MQKSVLCEQATNEKKFIDNYVVHLYFSCFVTYATFRDFPQFQRHKAMKTDFIIIIADYLGGAAIISPLDARFLASSPYPQLADWKMW